MKILYITLENVSLHKGSVVHIKEVVEGLQKNGHHVDLVGIASNETESGCSFYNIYPPRLFRLKRVGAKSTIYFGASLLLFFYLIKNLRRFAFIYARDFHTVIIALLPRLIFRKRLIYEINGIANEEQKLRSRSILNRILALVLQAAEKTAARSSDQIISVTPQIASHIISQYGVRAEKVKVIGNGVNTKKFYPINDKPGLLKQRSLFGIKSEDIVVVFVGNLAPWQGVETLINVTPALRKQFQNIRFLIIGEGVLKTKLMEQVHRLEISDYFIFTGMVDYKIIPLLINIGDICVLPKRELKSGYSPLKLYEYMACGKPIISTKVKGLEFIESEGIGLLFEPDDPIGLEKALMTLIKDPVKRKEMGNKAYELVREKFNWEIRITAIEELIMKLA